MARTAKLYRRSPFLVAYWKQEQLLFHNYLTGKIVAASAEAAAFLDFCQNWESMKSILKHWPEYTAKSVCSSIRQLAQQTLLDSSTDRNPRETRRRRALKRWRAWNPAASLFHLSTKDAYSDVISQEEIRYISRLMEGSSRPRPERKYHGAAVVELDASAEDSEFSRVLLQRRTWRRFSPAKVKREAFASLMQLSFAVQNWLKIAQDGKLAQKTSPSGGSLHPLEAYAIVRKVEGIRPGIYHYDAIGRKLQKIKPGASAAMMQKYLAGQWWFREAAFVVFLTAVFGRTQWKYDYARAYRAILIEAGHVCQTFCLTATWLGLAPFCTIAIKDTAIERALKIDGIAESVIYAMGAGGKPEEKKTAMQVAERTDPALARTASAG